MKSRFLFPSSYKIAGWLFTFPFAVLGFAIQFGEFSFRFLDVEIFKDGSDLSGLGSNNNFTDELACIGLIIGLLLLAFSKEKREDEQIAKVRLESLQWSVYFNYGVLTVAILLVHGTYFLTVMTYNMFTLLVFFLARFNYILYKQNKLKEEAI